MCRRIEENWRRSRINFDCFTDGVFRRNSAVGISQTVGNKLRGCAIISDGLTDRIKQSPAELPTEKCRRYFTDSLKKITGCATISDGLTDRRKQSPAELRRYFIESLKKITGCATIFDGTYQWKSPTEITHPDAPAVRETTITDGISVGNYRWQLPTDKNKRRHFQKFWCAFQFISRRNCRRK